MMGSTGHRASPYIAIEGVIGVGKTTLARLLQPRFEARTILEAFDENPFLSDFYGDRARYAFQTQLFFLLSRYRQQQGAAAQLREGALLSDYIFEKDRLFAHLNIPSLDELQMYDRLYETLAERVTLPDLVVYLRARVDTLMGRIAMRDRTYERQMDRDYIAALRAAYERLFADYGCGHHSMGTSLLVIESDALDFVRNPEDLDAVEQRIRSALAGVRQPTLPVGGVAPKLPVSTPVRPAWELASAPRPEPRSEANWRALGDFLTLAEAVGRVGGALAQQAPVGPEGAPVAVRDGLRDAYGAMQRLAERTRVDLDARDA